MSIPGDHVPFDALVSAATVRHLSKDFVRITPGPGWSVVLFNCGSRIEAMVTSHDGNETIRLGLAPPRAGQAVNVKITEDRGADVSYVDVTDGY